MSTDWHPDIVGRKGPRYVVIADAIGDALAHGELVSGAQLPTQRELARRLNVTIGTVSRAYQEAERRGLVSGEVGRGTYVRENIAKSELTEPASTTAEQGEVEAPLKKAAVGEVTSGEPSTERSESSAIGSSRPASPSSNASQTSSPEPNASSVVHLFRKSDIQAPQKTQSVPAELPPVSSEVEQSDASVDSKAPASATEPKPIAAKQGTPHDPPKVQQPSKFERDSRKPINLASVRLPDASEPLLATALAEITGETNFSGLAAQSVAPMSTDLCQAASRVLTRFGVSAGASDIAVAPSGGLALESVLSVLTTPGDGILLDALVDPNLQMVAERCGLRLCPVQVDSHGLVPESFELACWSSNAKHLLTTPTAQNPLATTLSAERRQAILEIAERYGVTLVEWVGNLPASGTAMEPFAALAPHRTVHVTDLAASSLNGLRLGIVTAPAQELEKIGQAITRLYRFLPGVLTGLLDAVSTPDAWEKLTNTQLQILKEREGALTRALGADLAKGFRTAPGYGWLPLPKGWRSGDLAVAAAIRGVLVASAEHFQAGQGTVPRAIRVAWGGVSGVEDAANAGAILNQIISAPGDRDLPAV